jgi:hypothetical protein
LGLAEYTDEAFLEERVYVELWVSLASLLRSYTAAHGLNGDRQATVELGEERITVRYAEKWLDLQRSGERVNWLRENGSNGVLELTEAGRLRTKNDPRSPKARDLHPCDEDLSPGTPTWSSALRFSAACEKCGLAG